MDKGQKATEERIKEIEKRINKEFAQAEQEIEEELNDYLRRFKLKDEKWQEWVETGYKTEEQYTKWRASQISVGNRWDALKNHIAGQLVAASKVANQIARDEMPQVYADNFYFSTYQVGHDAKVNTSYAIYSGDAVARLIKDDPEMLHAPGKKVAKEIAEGKAMRWNRQQLQSVMMQGILQGESIPKLATRLANTVGEKDRKAAIRNARTMATGAQNAGRIDAYKRAQDMGIDLEQQWMAVMDNRTRHSHRWLDGEKRPVGEAFSNGCEYPGDPKGDPAEIYNCRCTLRGVVKGLESKAYQYRDNKIGNMTYDEWRNAQPKYNPITLPEEKAKAIKGSYLNEYRNGGNITPKIGSAHNVAGNGGEKVYYNSEADYSIKINGYDDKINNAVSDAARVVAETGSKDGNEWAALINTRTGEREFLDTDGYSDSVNCYHDHLSDNMDKHYIMVHNHDTADTLSFGDVCEMPQWENLDAVVSASNDGLICAAKSNGKRSNELMEVRFAPMYRQEYAKTKDGHAAENYIVKMFLKEFGEGGLIVHDGRL